jgi:hypothetical protein
MARYTDKRMLTLTPQLKRLSRPDNPPPFRITDRDLEILRTVARYRFMTSEQIARYLIMLDPATSSQQVLRRLQLLFYHCYLDRPRQQHLQLSTFSHLVYGLGREGARAIVDAAPHIDPHLEWSTKNARATTPHIVHTLETTEAMLHFERACRARGDLGLLDHHDLIPYFPAPTRDLADPFRLRVAVEHDGHTVALNAIPDRLVSVVLPDNRRYNLCFEIDRATMSIAARRLSGKSSFGRKIRAYYAAWQHDRHRDQWGFQGFRVLSVVPSEQRIKGMLTAQRKITSNRAAAMFLYTTPQRLAEHGAFAPIWISADGDGQRLLQ